MLHSLNMICYPGWGPDSKRGLFESSLRGGTQFESGLDSGLFESSLRRTCPLFPHAFEDLGLLFVTELFFTEREFPQSHNGSSQHTGWNHVREAHGYNPRPFRISSTKSVECKLQTDIDDTNTARICQRNWHTFPASKWMRTLDGRTIIYCGRFMEIK